MSPTQTPEQTFKQVELPREMFYEVALRSNPATFLALYETSRGLSRIGQDEVFWSRKSIWDYSNVPEKVPGRFSSWKDFYIYLVKDQTFEVQIYRFLGALPDFYTIKANYNTPVKDIIVAVLERFYTAWGIKSDSSYDTKAITVNAITKEYPYMLGTQQDWQIAYLAGINHITQYISEAGNNFFLLAHKEKIYDFPYQADIDELYSIVNNIVSLASMLKSRREELELNIPALEIIFTASSSPCAPCMRKRRHNANVISYECKRPGFDVYSVMEKILAMLDYKTNHLGQYPNIYVEITPQSS